MTDSTPPPSADLLGAGPRVRPRIACIGAANMDVKAQCLAPVAMGSSNPVTLMRGFGGVARNVAETLARLECDIAMVSRVGLDTDGDGLLAGLRALSVDTAMVGRSRLFPTATYTALLAPDGEMVVAFADMAIYDEMTPDLTTAIPIGLAAYDIWFVDANLPADTIESLLDAKPADVMLAADPVSVLKAGKIARQLDRVDLLFCNRDEAAYLADMPIRAPLDVTEAAHRLRAHGTGAVVISLGAQGAFVCSDLVYDFFPALPAAKVDVTGAGDALVAGVLYGQGTGLPLDRAVGCGLASAALALETTATVNPDLCPDLVARRRPASAAQR